MDVDGRVVRLDSFSKVRRVRWRHLLCHRPEQRIREASQEQSGAVPSVVSQALNRPTRRGGHIAICMTGMESLWVVVLLIAFGWSSRS